MITEDYCSFEVAKLLKEKGFDEACYSYYMTTKTLHTTFHNRVHVEEEPHFNSRDLNGMYDVDESSIEDICSAPTHQTAMKWLREVHMIGVFPSTYAFTVGENGSAKHVYGTAIINLNTHELMTNDLMPMPTYEDATEAAIKYCLENLI